MKPTQVRILLFGMVACLGAIGVGVHAQADQLPRLYVIGDSTAADFEADRAPLTGWAQVLSDHFDPQRIVVENKARSGRSSKSFLDEGAWEEIRSQLKPGDYVMIQFGHNDSTKSDPNRYTEPATTYKEYLKRYVDDTRAQGATPILLTSINRCAWVNEKELRDTMGDYPTAVRELAQELDVPLIDMHRLTKELFERLGQEQTSALFMNLKKGEHPNYPDGSNDGSHLQESGARAVCELAIEAIRRLDLPLKDTLTSRDQTTTEAAAP